MLSSIQQSLAAGASALLAPPTNPGSGAAIPGVRLGSWGGIGDAPTGPNNGPWGAGMPGTPSGPAAPAQSWPGFAPFKVGAAGYFPYQWQDPASGKFNTKTYEWISANLRAGAEPIQLDQYFRNTYIRALAAISYSFSTVDKAKLQAAEQVSVTEQEALVAGWIAAGFGTPAGPRPIDQVIATIAHEWASPPTTLLGMERTNDLRQLLNKMPAAGAPVLQALQSYLSALIGESSLINASSMNNGYLARALAAVQTPSSSNGGLLTTDGVTRPAYTVATSVADIVAGLAVSSSEITSRMSVADSGGALAVTPAGESSFLTPAKDFLEVTDGRVDALTAATALAPMEVELSFPGVVPVYFGPARFDSSSGSDWFWMTPITDAIGNGSADVTGFKFNPRPQIDFSRSGPFAFLSAVAISRHPRIAMTATGASSPAIAKTLDALPATNWDVTFLGIPLGKDGPNVGYTSTVTASANSVHVQFDPPRVAASAQSDPTAFVLGVQPEYPAA